MSEKLKTDTEDISAYERIRLSNMERNFNILKSRGLTPRIPNFMKNKKKKGVRGIQEEINQGFSPGIPNFIRNKDVKCNQEEINQAEIRCFEGHDGLFSTRGALKIHQKIHPGTESDKKPKRHHCSYSTNRAPNLPLTHSGEKRHACPHCHKAFTRMFDLKRHILIHTGEKPFSCSTCGAAFNRSSHLRRHQRVHNGERSYRCETCGKAFNRAEHLQAHKRIHTQQKPYKCSQCDYTATNSSNLKTHTVRKHTRDFGHTCSICGKGFGAPSRLRKHTVRAHAAVTISTKRIHE